jgi:hypothetical protein
MVGLVAGQVAWIVEELVGDRQSEGDGRAIILRLAHAE